MPPARALLSSYCFAELLHGSRTLATVRWAATLDRDAYPLLLSVVTIGEVAAEIARLPVSDPRHGPYGRSFSALVDQFTRRGSVLDFTARGAQRWSELEALDLPWHDPRGGAAATTMALPTVARQVAAQAMVADPPAALVAPMQPCYDTLAALGLVVLDPSERANDGGGRVGR